MAVLALVVITLLVVFAVRVRRLARRVGSFECAVRPTGRKDWTSGIAVFGVGRVDWYRLISLSLRPNRSFARANLVLGERVHRPASGAGRVIEIRCRLESEDVELAMRQDSLAGLVSWLESAPPRGDYYV